MQGSMFRGGVGNVVLAPVSEVLSRLVVQVYSTALAAKDVLIDKSSFNEVSRYLTRMVPVFKELQEKNVRDTPSMRLALDSLERAIKVANDLIVECSTRSRVSLLYSCRDVTKRLQDVTQEIGRCLNIIPMATLDVSMETRDLTVELYKHMQAVQFKAAVGEEEIIEKIDIGMKERQSDNDYISNLLVQIAQVVGTSSDPLSLRDELDKLRQEKEDALLRKSKAEAVQLEQIIAFLSQADTVHSPSVTDRDYQARRSSGAQRIPPMQPFYCPITREVMEDPVEIASGKTFERSAIKHWFSQGHHTCPITNMELTTLDLQPNISLCHSIREWKERNTHVSIGATESKLVSDVEEDVMGALRELSRLSEEKPIHRDWIQTAGLIPVIVGLLSRSHNRNIRQAALCTVCSLAVDNPVNKEKIAAAGAIQHAVHSLARDVREGTLAVALLLELSKEPKICDQISKVQGCILLLVSMSNSANQTAAEDAKKLLSSLSSNNQNVVQMAEANYFKPLVQQLLEGSEMTKILMASALARMGLTDQSKARLAVEGAVPPLVKMISSGKLEAKTAALGALQNLSTHSENRGPMINAGVIPPLLQLLFSVTSVLMNLKEQAAATLANLASAAPLGTGADSGCSILESEDTICQLLSLLNLVGPTIQGHLLRALYGMGSFPAAKMREAGAIQLLFPFLEGSDVDVRVYAVKLMLRLSQGGAGKELAEHLGETYTRALVRLLVSPREDEKAAAAGIIGNLPENDTQLTEMLLEADALSTLVELLRAGGSRSLSRNWRGQLMECASRALVRFTIPSDVRLQLQTAEHGAIPLLVQVLNTGSPPAKREAAIVLAQFSESSLRLSSPIADGGGFWCFWPKVVPGCKVHKGCCSVTSSFCLIEAKAVVPLVQILEEQEDDAHEAALSALATLMKDDYWDAGVQVIAEAQGLRPIVRLLTVGNAGVKEKAVWMLERFFRVDEYKKEAGAQAQMPLIDLTQKGTLAAKSLAARGLAHLNIIHNQSTYF